MEEKPINFIGLSARYVILACGFSLCPNGYMIYAPEKSAETMGLLYLYSISIPVVIALYLVFFVNPKRSSRFDKIAAFIIFMCVFFAGAILAREFYTTLTSLKELPHYISTNTCLYPCKNIVVNLWAIAICLGMCSGMVALSAGILFRRQAEKPKNDTL